jgi:N-acetylmuramoyl-L-alanine amidase
MSNIVIVLDPGHDETSTNGGPTTYREWEGNMITAEFVRDILLAKYSNVTVKMTRKRGQRIGLEARGKLGAGSDLFHSIHSNAGPSTARGTEVFYSVDLLQDKTFAATMSSAIALEFNTANRGAKTKESAKYPGEDYFTVVDVAQDIGAKHVLLSESLFHSNPGEESILKDAKNLKKIAEIIVGVYAQFLTLETKADPVKNQASPYAQASWAKACEQGVFDWTSPQGPLTREQAAVVFDRLGLLD